MSFVRQFLAGVGMLCLLGQSTSAAEFSDQQKRELSIIIKEYLIQNPEVIREALQELERRQAAEASDKAKQTISSRAKEIYQSKEDLVLGNPRAKSQWSSSSTTTAAIANVPYRKSRNSFNPTRRSKSSSRNFRSWVRARSSPPRRRSPPACKGKYVEFHIAMTSTEGAKDESNVSRSPSKLVSTWKS